MGQRRPGVLTGTETTLLVALLDEPDYAPALAARTRINSRTAAHALRRLETQGYVRTRWRVPDLRAQLVFAITPKGKRALAKAEQAD